MGPRVSLGGSAASLPLEKRIDLGKQIMNRKDIQLVDKLVFQVHLDLLDPFDYFHVLQKFGSNDGKIDLPELMNDTLLRLGYGERYEVFNNLIDYDTYSKN